MKRLVKDNFKLKEKEGILKLVWKAGIILEVE